MKIVWDRVDCEYEEFGFYFICSVELLVGYDGNSILVRFIW